MLAVQQRWLQQAVCPAPRRSQFRLAPRVLHRRCLRPAAQQGSSGGEERLGTASDRHRRHLELLWAASGSATEQRSKVEQCTCCRGSGERECDWCHGTGAMTVGDMLYCSEGGCAQCPVCRGSGALKCENCRGTGRRATWLPLAPP